MKLPKYLKPGDTIAIVCPAGFMPKEKAETCINVLQDWGYRVRIGATLAGGSQNYFSGTDAQRLADLQQMLDDDEVSAILCGQGGYGVGRIIEQIDFTKFKKKPKWIIGYSDITILLAHIYSNFGIASLHAPMAAAFNRDEFKNPYVQSLRTALSGKRTKYTVDPHVFNRAGSATGQLVGGNLSLLAHITGTSSDIQTKGKILFLEDVGENIYNIDRMMYQLKRTEKLNKLAGLIFGGFTDIRNTERPFGESVHQLLLHVVEEFNYPVCFDFPVSHAKENYALKVGVPCTLKVTKTTVTLSSS